MNLANIPLLRSCVLVLPLMWGVVAAEPHTQSETQDPSLRLARTYFDHLNHQRLDAARALMADTIVFEDPTWGSTPTTTADALIKAYSATAGFSNFLFDERLAFSSNGTVVIHYVVSFDYLPADSSLESPVPVLGDLVRMATVKDGKVVRHLDLAPYGELHNAVKRAQAKGH